MSVYDQSYDTLATEQKRYLVARLLAERQRRRRIDSYYPDAGYPDPGYSARHGPFKRDGYAKHLAFFAAGREHKERLMLAANRVGKTEGVGGYETALHLTGQYPHWWQGRRFDAPISAWAAGDTGETVRDIIQFKLLGPLSDRGTGLLPADTIIRTTPRPGLPDAIKDVYVKHTSGGLSHLAFKSYDQKRISFQGTEKHLVWLDEEPPIAIYTECLLRTMTVNGMMLCTFTPLLGLSDVVMSFLPGGKLPGEV